MGLVRLDSYYDWWYDWLDYPSWYNINVFIMKYFSINELSKSNTAIARKLDNTPSKEVITNLEALVDNVLDPLREMYGKPIIVTSGYRSPEVNRSVNGATSSQHVRGEAADITVGTKEGNKELFDIIKEKLPFD